MSTPFRDAGPTSWLEPYTARKQIKPGEREGRCPTYGFADVLSLEGILGDLRTWDAPDWRAAVERYRRWSTELFDALA